MAEEDKAALDFRRATVFNQLREFLKPLADLNGTKCLDKNAVYEVLESEIFANFLFSLVDHTNDGTVTVDDWVQLFETNISKMSSSVYFHDFKELLESTIHLITSKDNRSLSPDVVHKILRSNGVGEHFFNALVSSLGKGSSKNLKGSNQSLNKDVKANAAVSFPKLTAASSPLNQPDLIPIDHIMKVLSQLTATRYYRNL